MNENKLKKIFKQYDADKEQIRTNVIKMAEVKITVENRRFRFKPVFAVCLCLVLGVSAFSGYLITAEAFEYKEAVSYFTEKNISTEGLTRSEIKEVYKDITMKTYNCSKTKEIINKCNVEINSTNLGQSQNSYDDIWDESVDTSTNQYDKGVWYTVRPLTIGAAKYDSDYEKTQSEIDALNEDSGHYFRNEIIKYKDGVEQWRYNAPYDMEIDYNSVVECDYGVVVYGKVRDIQRQDNMSIGFAHIFLLSDSGELIWEYSEPDYDTDYETAVISENEIALFGSLKVYTDEKYENNHLYDIFTVLGKDGNVQKHRVNKSMHDGFYDTGVKLGNSFILKQCSCYDNYHPELISISADGEHYKKIEYSDNETTYEITDIISHNGKLYISANIPNMTAESFSEQFTELEEELYSGVEDPHSYKVPEMSEDFHKRLKDLFAQWYTAVLLICDENTVITKEHSVANAQAGTLGTDEQGRLIWQTSHIDDVRLMSRNNNCGPVHMEQTDFSLVFDDDGKMIEKSEIGKN